MVYSVKNGKEPHPLINGAFVRAFFLFLTIFCLFVFVSLICPSMLFVFIFVFFNLFN